MSNFIAESSQIRKDTKNVISSWFNKKMPSHNETSSSSSSVESKPMPNLSWNTLLNPNSPWVLVKDGNFMGYFDWVPIHLRVGPWHINSIILLSGFAVAIVYQRPELDSLFKLHPISTTNTSPSDINDDLWYCSVFLFLFMLISVIVMCLARTPGIIATFTIQSWLMNAMRFGIQAFLTPYRISHLSPIVRHGMINIHNLLRFPAFATALITFLFWNFIIGPYLFLFALPYKYRNDFLRWNLSFKLVQLHFCNIIYSFINVFVTDALIVRYSTTTNASPFSVSLSSINL